MRGYRANHFASALARLALLACLIAGTDTNAGQRAAPSEQAASISTALRFATLTERIAMLHAQIGQNILTDRAHRALTGAIAEFEAGLRAMGSRGSAGEIRDNYLLLSNLWPEYRAWALKAATPSNARKLAERTEEVVWVADKGARLLIEQARAATTSQALTAARACTLSQRIAKLYLLRRWGIRDEKFTPELKVAEIEYRRALQMLHEAPQNTPEVLAQLQLAENQSRFLEQAAEQFERGKDAARQIEFIAKSGDHLFEIMQRVVSLYESAAP